MKWIIVDPRGVGGALAGSNPSPLANFDRYVEPTPSAKAVIEPFESIEIYSEGYFSRIVEALEGDFKISRQVLGEEDFQRIVAEYLKHFPSRETNIGEVGRNLPKFFRGLYTSSAHPYLEDLFEIEWAAVESFYAEDVPSMDLSQLAAFSETDWEKARFELDPSLRLFNSDWPLDKFWNARHLESIAEVIASTKKQKTYLMIFRQTGFSEIEGISEAEFAVIHQIQKGAPLGEVSTYLAESGHSVELVRDYFSRWAQLNLIKRVYLGENNV
jgi:Putative DNA-binding domain